MSDLAKVIIEDYKKHYSLPYEPASASHLEDCIDSALESVLALDTKRRRLVGGAPCRPHQKVASIIGPIFSDTECPACIRNRAVELEEIAMELREALLGCVLNLRSVAGHTFGRAEVDHNARGVAQEYGNSKGGRAVKITEKSDMPGTCFVCGQPIYVGDVIVRQHLGTTPVAAHVQCDPDFALGGACQ